MTREQTDHKRGGAWTLDGKIVSKAQEDRLIRRAQGSKGVPPDERARRALVEYMRPRVAKYAREYRGRGVDFDDLVQVGEEAVLRAVDSYTLLGWRFESYARHWIHHAIQRAIANQARTIRVPERRVKLAGKEKVARAQLTQELGRAPTDYEVAQEMNVPVKDVWRVAIETAPIESSEKNAEDAQGNARLSPQAKRAQGMLEHFLDRKADPLKILLHKEWRAELAQGALEVLCALEDRDRRVLILRYVHGLPRRQIAEALEISEKAVRHSENRGWRTVRDNKKFRYMQKIL